MIDVKDDDGRVAWRDSQVAVARETGADSHTNFTRSAAKRRIRELRDAAGYPIARIVCFKDPIAAPARPELAIEDAGGGVWRDRKGMGWLDANEPEAWDYIVDLGREAAAMGFLEVQFDYVRFPTDGTTSSAVYDDGEGVDTSRIRDFLAHAREELHAEGVRVSADIFGLTTYKAEGEGDGDGTGQLFEDVIAEVDYVSPMVYPSHYYPGRVSDQMRATYENGIESWLLWNANNRYSRAALEPTETYRAAQPAPPTPTDTPPEAP